MDSKYKALLQHHRPFLARNIIWSPQLADMFRSHGLITDFMIKDINSCPSREDQIHRLIDVIPLKGTGAFNKFLDVLMLSGHVFISDFLREDEENQKLFDVKDMYKALPFVQRAFNETEKKAIETYMAERIENQVLKLLWKRDNREKDKALVAKMKQIEQSYEFEDYQQAKAEAINKMEKEINASLEDKQELKTKLKALTNAHREMEAKHKEAMAIQMRYNSANDNAIEKAKQTITNLENLLRSMHAKMENELKRNSKDFPKDISNANNESNVDKNKKDKSDENGEGSLVGNTNFGFVLGDLNKLIARYRYLLDIKIRHDRLIEEKEYILIHFGYPESEAAKQKAGGTTVPSEPEPSMVKAYKDFCVRNDENMDKMKKEIEKYDGLLEENKAKLEDLTKEKDASSKKMAHGVNAWQGAIMNVMRTQLQDMKTDSRKKESMMAMQEEEMTKLKYKITELENRLACSNFNQPESLSVIQSRDLVDGRVSAVSNDSVELIVSETPKPARNKNLPPLKSSTKQNVPTKGGSSSPRGTVMRSKPHVPNSRGITEPVKSFITFPIGPITTQLKPDVRGRPMGSVLGDLKAMNKHHGKTMIENPRSAWKQNGSASVIK